jgi:hypothetical protein
MVTKENFFSTNLFISINFEGEIARDTKKCHLIIQTHQTVV